MVSIKEKKKYKVLSQVVYFLQGRIQEFVQGGYIFSFSFQGGTQHPLGPENPLKSIDFTGSGGAYPP